MTMRNLILLLMAIILWGSGCASHPPVLPQTPKEGETAEQYIEAGRALYQGGDESRGVTACIACHGPKGNGMGLAGFPDISGQHVTYTAAQLKSFRAGERHNDMNGMMRDIAMKLTDEDIEILSNYIAGLH